MTRWFMVAFVSTALLVVVRLGRIVELITHPSLDTIGTVAVALVLPVAALLGWRWSRTRPTPYASGSSVSRQSPKRAGCQVSSWSRT